MKSGKGGAHRTMWCSVAVTVLYLSIPALFMHESLQNLPTAAMHTVNIFLFLVCFVITLRAFPFFLNLMFFPIQSTIKCETAHSVHN